MDIIDIIKEQACSVSLEAKTKKECLLELAQNICLANPSLEAEAVLQAFEKREEQGSTGFENGIAIPHARMEGIDAFTLAIAVSQKGIDFKSTDKKRSRLFFALVGPAEHPNDFLRLLAQIALVTKSAANRKEFLNAKSPLVLKEIFLQSLPGGLPESYQKGKKKLLTIVLYETQYLDAISELFLEHRIQGASIADSTGMRGVLTKVPLFADFFDFLGERKEESKTITAIISENQVRPLVEGVESIMGDLDAHSGAAVYVTDLAFAKGSLEV